MSVTFDAGTASAHLTLSNNNLTATHVAGDFTPGVVCSNTAITSKQCFEVTLGAVGFAWIGVCDGTQSTDGSGPQTGYPHGYNQANSGTWALTGFSSGDTILVAVDPTAKRLWMKNLTQGGGWNAGAGGGDPTAGTGGMDISALSTIYPFYENKNEGEYGTFNPTPDSSVLPSGYAALSPTAPPPTSSVTFDSGSASTHLTLSSDKLTATHVAGDFTPSVVRANAAISGKQCFQVTLGTVGFAWIGVCDGTQSTDGSGPLTAYPHGYNQANSGTWALTGFSSNDQILVAVDATAKRLWMKNVTQGTGWNPATGSGNDPATGVGGMDISALGTIYPFYENKNAGESGVFNPAPAQSLIPSGFQPMQGPASAILDPLSASTHLVLSNGNLTATHVAGDFTPSAARCDTPITSKQCFEITLGTVGFAWIGVCDGTQSTDGSGPVTGYPHGYNQANSGTWALTGFSSGDQIRVAVDPTAKLLWMKNVTQNTGWNPAVAGSNDPATGVGGLDISALSTIYPFYANKNAGESGTLNPTPSVLPAGYTGLKQSAPVPPPTGPVPDVDMDFVTPSYKGGAAADLSNQQPASLAELNHTGALSTAFAANTVRQTDTGIHVLGESVTYVGANALRPASWTPVGGATIVADTGATGSPIFTNSRILAVTSSNDYAKVTLLQQPSAGQTVIVKLAVRPVSGFSSNVWVQAVWAAGVKKVGWIGAPVTTEPGNKVVWQPAGADAPSTLLRSSRPDAQGFAEVVFTVAVPSTGFTSDMEIRIYLSPDGAQKVSVGACQVTIAKADYAYQDVSTTAINASADQLTVGGYFASLLAQPKGWIGMEVQGLSHSTIGTVGYAGSSRGVLLKVGTASIFEPDGPTAFRAKGSTQPTAIGLSGYRGIVRLAITWDNTANGGAGQWYAYANGGKAASGSGAVGGSGTVQLLAGVSGQLRRLSGSATPVSTASLQDWTCIYQTPSWNQTFPNPGNALVAGSATQTFYDDYDGLLEDSLRSQPASARNYPYSSTQAMTASYTNGGPNAKWIPRYFFYTQDPSGEGGSIQTDDGSGHIVTVSQAINGEHQHYGDPAQPGGWSGSHVVQNGCMELHLKLTPAGTSQTVVPIDHNTGSQFPYMSACMSTTGFFKQSINQTGQSGALFSSRDLMPAFRGSWPAFWTFDTTNGTSSEIDIEEYLGDNPAETTSTLHLYFGPGDVRSDGGGFTNIGYDLSKDFHDRTAVWTSTAINKYLDGELVDVHTPNTTMNGTSMDLLYDFAIYPPSEVVNGVNATQQYLSANGEQVFKIDRTLVLSLA